MPVTTSGTTSGYFTQRKVIEHAARRAGYAPQQLAPEWLQVAQDLLFLQLSEYINAGMPLWTQEFLVLGCQVGSPDVLTPQGTVDILHTYWRILEPWRGAAQLFDGSGASVLFAGQPSGDLTIPGPNPFVQVNFGSPTEVDTLGILPGGAAGSWLVDGYGNPITDGFGNVIVTASASTMSVSAAPYLTVSTDGITWYPGQTLPTAIYTAGQWTYADLNPSITTPFLRINWPDTNSWLLNQLNLGLANGQDTEIGPLNIDDYYDLPDKFFRSNQANSAYTFRKIDPPIIKIWPTLNQQGFYNGTISALARRYIQDPGQMTNTLEIPPRWTEGVISRLGVRLMDELPDPSPDSQASYFTLMAKTQKRQILETAATKAEAMMWAEERTRGPIRIVPNLRPYTA